MGAYDLSHRVAVPGTSWCPCDKYWLLPLSHLARRTSCPILLLSSRFQFFWAEPALCPNLRSSLSLKGGKETAALPNPLGPSPTLHSGGPLPRESKSGGMPDPFHPDPSFFPTYAHILATPQSFKHPGFSHLLENSPPHPPRPYFKLCS